MQFMKYKTGKFMHKRDLTTVNAIMYLITYDVLICRIDVNYEASIVNLLKYARLI